MRRKKVVLHNVVMENYAAEGRSLARVEGKVIFVENTIPGDEVDVLLQKNKNSFIGSKFSCTSYFFRFTFLQLTKRCG